MEQKCVELNGGPMIIGTLQLPHKCPIPASRCWGGSNGIGGGTESRTWRWQILLVVTAGDCTSWQKNCPSLMDRIDLTRWVQHAAPVRLPADVLRMHRSGSWRASVLLPLPVPWCDGKDESNQVWVIKDIPSMNNISERCPCQNNSLRGKCRTRQEQSYWSIGEVLLDQKVELNGYFTQFGLLGWY